MSDAPVSKPASSVACPGTSWTTESLFETVVDPLMNARRHAGFSI